MTAMQKKSLKSNYYLLKSGQSLLLECFDVISDNKVYC